MPILGLNGQPIGVDNLFHGIAQQPAAAIKSTPARQPAVPMQMPRRAPMSPNAKQVPQQPADAPHSILDQSNASAAQGVSLPGDKPRQVGQHPLGETGIF